MNDRGAASDVTTDERATVSPIVAGAAGGIALAIVDLLPSVMWLPETDARLWLVLRTVGLLGALGAWLGALWCALERASARLIRRPWGAALLACVVAAPPSWRLVSATFAGPQASRLPFVWAIQLAGLIALLGGVFALAHRVSVRGAPRRWPARALAFAFLVGLAVGLSQCDRLLYPRHYEPLHGALTVASFVLAGLGMAAVLPRARASRHGAVVLVGVASVVAALVLVPLTRDHDGRAALLSPRNSHCHSVMLAAAPLLYAAQRQEASEAARGQAERARAARVSGDSSLSFAGAHLVLITIDALRADHLGLYGYPRPISPNLDRLAARSVVFERAWIATPRSSYSISSFFTGRPTHGLLDTDGPTIADALGEAGLYTAALYPDGIFYHEPEHFEGLRRRSFGFARHDAENHDATSLTDAVLSELRDLEARGEPQSFLWIHYFDVHEPYRERSLGERPIDRYDGEIRNVDRALREVLEALDGLTRDVILVISADHGEEFLDHGGRFHGASLYEEQLRVPLIIRAPGLAPRRVTQPVSMLDVPPTLLALLGVPPLREAVGTDLRPLLSGDRLDRGPVFATETGMRAVLLWPDKLIEQPDLGSVELFDLSRDPGERHNLAGVSPERVDRLRAEWSTR